MTDDKPRKISWKAQALMRSATAQAERKPYRAIQGTARKPPPITLPKMPWDSADRKETK